MHAVASCIDFQQPERLHFCAALHVQGTRYNFTIGVNKIIFDPKFPMILHHKFDQVIS